MIYNLSKFELSFLDSHQKKVTSFSEIDEDVSAVIIEFNEEIKDDVKKILKLYPKIKVITYADYYLKERHYFALKYKMIYVEVEDEYDFKILLKNLKLYEKNQELQIDYNSNYVTFGKDYAKLTYKEIEILQYLYEKKGNICTRQDILVDVLLYHPDADQRIIDVYIKYLRNKLKTEGKRIKTIRGKGYILEER